MSFTPVTRTSAWTYWSKGMISATNIDMMIEWSEPNGTSTPIPHQILASLAIKRGINAIRLWFGYARDFTFMENDIAALVADPNGWSSTAQTPSGSDASHTFKFVADQIQKILDTCASLGMGVLMVTNYHQDKDLWDPTTNRANELGQFWIKTYQRFGLHPALIGFDICNEPTPDPTYRTFASFRSDTNAWPTVAKNIIAGIRNYESAQTITSPMPLIVEGIYAGAASGLAVFDGPEFTATTGPFINDKHVVFSFHYYDPGPFTHQGVTEWDYEHIGTAYPVPGTVQTSYWYDGKPNYDLREYQTPAHISASVKVALDFAKKFSVPMFVGEFSATQPNIDEVYPKLTPPRSQQFPNQRLSEVQNTVAWQYPLLCKLAGIHSQADFNALSASDQASVIDVFNATKRRWITRLEVDSQGNMTATMGNVVNSDALGDGFHVAVSPASRANLLSMLQQKLGTVTLPMDTGKYWAAEGADNFLNDQFYNQPLASVIGKYTTSSGVQNMVASSCDTGGGQQVTLVRHGSTIKFKAPTGVAAGTVFDGFTCTVPSKDANGNAIQVQVKMPVALLLLQSPRSAAAIDQSRFDFARDCLQVWRSNNFSWSWHCDDSNDGAAYLGWRPSADISELMASAASGRMLAVRA